MGATRLVASYDDVVIKSPNDRRSYRILHLPNGLFALLVHDPEIYSDKYPSQSESQQAPEEDEDMEEVGSDNEEEEEEAEDDEEEDDDEELDLSEEEDEKKGGGSEVNKKKGKEQTVKKVNFVSIFFCFQLSL
jgi:nardilysin